MSAKPKKPRSRSAIGKAAKLKGKVAEREVVDLLKTHGFDARRSQQFCGYAANDPDILCPGLPSLAIEVKRREAFRLYDAIEQAQRDCNGTGKSPIVFHRQNDKPWIIVMEANDFLKLIKR